jgi:hypothetical protein
MLQSEFQTLVSLWLAAEKTHKNVPSRTSFDPMRLRGLLPQVHILEFDGPQRLVYRLSGTSEVWRLGHDPKNQDYFDFVDQDAAQYLRTNMHETLFHPSGLLIYTDEIYPDGFALPTQFLALPLHDATRDADQVIALVIVPGHQKVNIMIDKKPEELPWYDYISAIEPYDIGYGKPNTRYFLST